MKTNFQRAEKVYQLYESNLIQLLEGREDYNLICTLCEKLIKSIAAEHDLNINTDMHFNYLFETSGALDSEYENFIDAVYLLSSQAVKILIQRFHYRDVVTNHWTEISRSEVFLAFKRKEFYHPQEDRELTLDEYNKIICPYFLPTPEFIEKLESIQ